MTLKTYSTTFAATENPLSESGSWDNGGSVGLDWADVSSASNRAIGNQTGATGTDATAVLHDNTWPADQEASVTVFVDAVPGATCFPEIEIRLRSVITAHVNRGYEIAFGFNGYLIIVRWNGAVGDFTSLLDDASGDTTRFIPVTGDVLTARVVGGVISAYKNNILMGRVVDSTWTDGAPGIGFNLENGAGACAGANVDYGITAFSATEIATPTSGLLEVAAGGRTDADTTIVCLLERPIAIGDTIACAMLIDTFTASGVTLSDGTANVYARIETNGSAPDGKAELWVCERAKVAVAGNPTLTLTLSTSCGFRLLMAYHYRGRVLVGPHAGTLTATPSGTDSATSGSVIAPLPSLVIGFAIDVGSQVDHNYTAGTGFTLRGASCMSLATVVEDLTQTVAGAKAATFTPIAAHDTIAFVLFLVPDSIAFDYSTFPKQLIAERAQGIS